MSPSPAPCAGRPTGGLLTFFERPPSTPFAAWVSVVPAGGGNVKPLTKLYRGSVLAVEWYPDSAHVAAQAVEGTREALGVSFGAHPYVRRAVYDAHSPIAFIRNCRTPTLVLHGLNDPGVPVGQGHEFHTALRSMGVPAEMVVYPRERHSIREYGHQFDLQKRVLDWFDRYLR